MAGRVSDRSLYFLYDSISESEAEAVLRAALDQFKSYVTERCICVHTSEQVDDVIHAAQAGNGIVFHLFANEDLRAMARSRAADCHIHVVDWLAHPIDALGDWLEMRPAHHSTEHFDDKYFRLLEALRFRRKHDDGKNPEGLPDADMLLLGISRSLKTPISLMLTEEGFSVANIPVVPEVPLPQEVKHPRLLGRIYVLRPRLIDVKVAREERDLGHVDDNANYANMQRIQYENTHLSGLLQQNPDWIPIDVSRKAPEEAAKLIRQMHLEHFPRAA